MWPLSDNAQRYLLWLARHVLEQSFQGKPVDVNALAATLPDATLARPAGAFVTLHHHHRLRGCIGYMQAHKPLYVTVAECAQAAAFHDPRFPPLAADELPQVEIEISVLSPCVEIRPEEVEVGKHGLVISQDFYRGVLLPQVAVEQGWERERFLEETCYKAGLPPDAWKKGARLEAFTACVFSESSVKASKADSSKRTPGQ